MIEIKSLGPPPDGSHLHWLYGSSHMVRISRLAAEAMCHPGSLPSNAWELKIGSRRLEFSEVTLMIQNNGGEFYIYSPQVKIEDWPELFGVKVVV